MASGLLHNKDLNVKKISLGTAQTLTAGAVFSLTFTDNTLLGNIYGCVGYSLEDRSLGSKLGIEAVFASGNSIIISGYCITGASVPATAYVIALVRGY